MPIYLGIDVGGTSVKAGVVDAAGNILAQTTLDSSDATPEILVQHVLSFATPYDVKAAALAVPGPVSSTGELMMLPNMQIDLQAVEQGLQKHFGSRSVYFVNDANAAALGEAWKGAAAGVREMVFLTLGTGIGAGIVQDGKLLQGANGSAGEIGHLGADYDEDAPLCGCGKQGCLELYASARGVVNLYKQHLNCFEEESVELQGPADSKAVFAAAAAGSKAAERAVLKSVTYLGRALADIAVMLNPETIVLGGGMSAAYPQFIRPLTKAFQTSAIPAVRDTPIKQAVLGNSAGMIGAAAFAMQGEHENTV